MALTRPREANPTPKATTRLLAFLLLALLVFGVGHYLRPDPPDSLVPRATLTGAPVPPPTSRARAATVEEPGVGTSGKFAYATGYGPLVGRAGPIHRYRVAVELPGRAGAATDFAHAVDDTLGDPRSWIAAGHLRLRRVPYSAHADFTVYLASARTSTAMCRHGGLETDGYTSCRLPHQVIINDTRWTESVRGYGAPLATYRAYAINHEVGHQLGHGHEACTGRTRLAPVMMQQTYGLKGCLANAWPYVNGHRYTGTPTR